MNGVDSSAWLEYFADGANAPLLSSNVSPHECMHLDSQMIYR